MNGSHEHQRPCFYSLFLGLKVGRVPIDAFEDVIPEVVVACGLGFLVRKADVHIDVEVGRIVFVVVFQSEIDLPLKVGVIPVLVVKVVFHFHWKLIEYCILDFCRYLYKFLPQFKLLWYGF